MKKVANVLAGARKAMVCRRAPPQVQIPRRREYSSCVSKSTLSSSLGPSRPVMNLRLRGPAETVIRVGRSSESTAKGSEASQMLPRPRRA